jgi:galactose mutarotase-like enzyme
MTVRVESEWSYRGLQALVLENERVRVVVLPELGGKIWQLTVLRTGRELLWHNPRMAARTIPFGSVYDDVFLGGWDELFPNDVPEELAGELYPDHGELWASPWQWSIERAADEVRVTLELRTPISACTVTKTLTLRGGEASLAVRTRITNPTSVALPYLWKQHVAMPTNEPATIGLGAATVLVGDFGSPRAGGPGDTYAWPLHHGADGTTTDMSPTLPRESGVSEFQYATELAEGRCSVTYADGTGLELLFDRDVFRSCWLFASYGGWRDHEVVVLEPCTGHPVSVQEGLAAGTHQVLEPGASVETELTAVVLDGLEKEAHR